MPSMEAMAFPNLGVTVLNRDYNPRRIKQFPPSFLSLSELKF